jgi:hypothetical protein
MFLVIHVTRKSLPDKKKQAEAWEYIRIPALAFLPGFCFSFHPFLGGGL